MCLIKEVKEEKLDVNLAKSIYQGLLYDLKKDKPLLSAPKIPLKEYPIDIREL